MPTDSESISSILDPSEKDFEGPPDPSTVFGDAMHDLEENHPEQARQSSPEETENQQEGVTPEDVFGPPVEEIGPNLKIFEYQGYEGETKRLYSWEMQEDASPYKLPDGVFVIGGGARVVVQKMLGDEVGSPRDIDVAIMRDFVSDDEEVDNLLADVEEEYDEESGKTEDIFDYLSTRDFTINEVLVGGKHCFATEQALEDLRNKVARPTEFESESWFYHSNHERGVPPKLVMKALRLASELQVMYGKGSIEGIEDWQFQIENVPLFFLALHLDRAVESGDEVAQRTFTNLLKTGVIREGDPLVEEYGDVYSNDPYSLARVLSLHFFERDSERGYRPFMFNRRDLNIDEPEQLDWYRLYQEHYGDLYSTKPAPETLKTYKYADMAEAYFKQKGIKGEGYNEWNHAEDSRPIQTIRGDEKDSPYTEEDVKNIHLDNEPVLNQMEEAFKKALQEAERKEKKQGS